MEYKLTVKLKKWLKTQGIVPPVGDTGIVLFVLKVPSTFKPVRTWTPILDATGKYVLSATS